MCGRRAGRPPGTTCGGRPSRSCGRATRGSWARALRRSHSLPAFRWRCPRWRRRWTIAAAQGGDHIARFSHGRLPVARQAGRGVELVVLESPDQVSVPVEAIAVRWMTDRLVVTSHVYFTSGAIQDIKRVAEAAHKSGALCWSMLPIGGAGSGGRKGHRRGLSHRRRLKWLLAGRASCCCYVRDELARQLAPAIAGWFGQRKQFTFDPRALDLHDDARRFELGTPALAAVYAQLGASTTSTRSGSRPSAA